MAAYYIERNGRAFGPFTCERVREMIVNGNLSRDDRVSTDKRAWKKASEFEEIVKKETQKENAEQRRAVSAPNVVVPKIDRSGRDSAVQGLDAALKSSASSDRSLDSTQFVVSTMTGVTTAERNSRANGRASERQDKEFDPLANDPDELESKMNSRFMMSWIFMTVSFLFVVAFVVMFILIEEFVSGNIERLPKFLSKELLDVVSGAAVVFFIASGIFILMFFHALWSSIPKRFARISPDVAIGLLFAFGWNIYWLFVVLCDGCKGLNYALNEDARSRRKGGEAPLTLAAITSVLLLLPGLYFIGIILLFVLMAKMKRVAVAVLNLERGEPQY